MHSNITEMHRKRERRENRKGNMADTSGAGKSQKDDPGYEAHVRAEEERYLAEWNNMSELHRAELEAAGLRPDTGHTYRLGWSADDESLSENPLFSEAEHVTDSVDTEADRIMERWGLDPEDAHNLIEYIHEREMRAINVECMGRIHRVIGLLISPCDDLQAVLWGLIYAADMEHYVADENGRSMNKKAQELGVSRALIHTYKDRFRDILKLKNNVHGKSDHHKEACQRAQTENHWQKRTGGDLIRGKG